MRRTNRISKVLFTGGILLTLLACAEGSLDNGDSANVVVAISNFPPVPPVTTQYIAATNTCIFTAPPAVAVTLKNLPKSELVQSPYGDVVIESALVTYTWDDGLSVGPSVQSTAGLIPVAGTATVPVLPVLLGDLTADRAGHSANIVVTFHGKTIDGKPIDSLPGPPGGAVISVNSCISTVP